MLALCYKIEPVNVVFSFLRILGPYDQPWEKNVHKKITGKNAIKPVNVKIIINNYREKIN